MTVGQYWAYIIIIIIHTNALFHFTINGNFAFTWPPLISIISWNLLVVMVAVVVLMLHHWIFIFLVLPCFIDQPVSVLALSMRFFDTVSYKYRMREWWNEYSLIETNVRDVFFSFPLLVMVCMVGARERERESAISTEKLRPVCVYIVMWSVH